MVSNPRLDTTVHVSLGDMMDTYFPPVDSNAFATTYPEDKTRRIRVKLQDAVKWEPVLWADMQRRGRIIPEAWVSLFPVS